MPATREETLALLKTAYSMEIETVMNYLANSVNLDGVSEEVSGPLPNILPR